MSPLFQFLTYASVVWQGDGLGVLYSCTDAMDIDNAEEFAEMAKKIIETTPDKVQVFIDMKHVHKQLAHHKCSLLVWEKSKDIDDDSDGSNTRDEPPAQSSSLRWGGAFMPSLKDGPHAGKIHPVPTVPITCGKDSPKAIQWIVSVFHSFKSQLTPLALVPETGWVHPDFMKLYQNNMLVHLCTQQALHKPLPPSRSLSKPHPGSGIPPLGTFGRGGGAPQPDSSPAD
ncbi:hypothetical protein F5J12DRAFT_779844 [Pisolithus orientalis]|uniref:uncharacterized protein n=1 Tax=Pisolithus orientalis TaxID=936130 RepID=UPI0022253204|nr:uncharacterized protein F5J12DRAFT_779844 [Pisolithus orientalis]KAI6030786.1 hypothetical protein F5J12DRAFT_779844 [Pisolithus orientalis]